MKMSIISLFIAAIVILGSFTGCTGAPSATKESSPSPVIKVDPSSPAVKVNPPSPAFDPGGVTSKSDSPSTTTPVTESNETTEPSEMPVSVFIKVIENIKLWDLPPAVINVAETIGVTDSPAITLKQMLPTIVSFNANPGSILSGGTSTLSWETSGAATVKLYPEIGSVRPTGTLNVSPSQTTTYTLEAANGDGTVNATVTVTVTVNPTRG